jgi:hypothetical protein
MKKLNWIAWSSAGIGSLFLLLGLIYSLIGHSQINGGRLFGDTEIINFFIASANFFVIAVFVLLIKNEFKSE